MFDFWNLDTGKESLDQSVRMLKIHSIELDPLACITVHFKGLKHHSVSQPKACSHENQ